MYDYYPIVTTVVGVFNHEEYVVECLDSIIATNYPNLEILIFDDASQDDCQNIIRGWIINHPEQKVVYIQHDQNIGLTKSLNEAIALSKGEYFCYISGDDVMLPSGIVDRVEYLMRNRDKLAVFADCHVVDGQGAQLYESGIENLRPRSGMRKKMLSIDGLLHFCIFFHWAVPGPVFMCRRETFSQVGLYDDKLMLEDWDMYLRIAAVGKLGFHNGYVAKFRLHDKNANKLYRLRSLSDMAKISKKHSSHFYGLNALRLAALHTSWLYHKAKSIPAKAFFFLTIGILSLLSDYTYRILGLALFLGHDSLNVDRLAVIVKRRPANTIFAIKRTAFLFKERSLRLSGFSKSHSHGINLVAYIRAEMGLGQAARGLASALEAAQIPFNILNFEHSNRARHGDGSWAHKESVESKHDITVLAINPDNIFNARRRLPTQIFVDRYVIGYWFWELPAIPDEWMEAFSLVNEVWAASRFVQDAIALKSPVPVFRVPPVIRVKQGDELSRQHFNLPDNQFLFLTICDTASILERKNPAGTIAAFKKAFAPNDRRVGLVLKISSPPRSSRLGDFARTIGTGNRQADLFIRDQIQGYDNIWLVDRLLTPEELRSLLKVTDCYVSLHRSEGFGLVPAESLSLGKPAIITRWSGNIDYMTDDNSVGIDYRLVRLGQDYGPYGADQHWADPDIDQAAHWMKKLFDDPALAAAIGKRGQQTILTKFSPEAVGGIINERLAAIGSESRRR